MNELQPQAMHTGIAYDDNTFAEPPPVPAALPPNLPRRAVAAITNNIVLVLGVAVLLVIAGAIILAWFDKTIPDAVVVMGGVALGYLGNAIQEKTK